MTCLPSNTGLCSLLTETIWDIDKGVSDMQVNNTRTVDSPSIPLPPPCCWSHKVPLSSLLLSQWQSGDEGPADRGLPPSIHRPILPPNWAFPKEAGARWCLPAAAGTLRWDWLGADGPAEKPQEGLGQELMMWPIIISRLPLRVKIAVDMSVTKGSWGLSQEKEDQPTVRGSEEWKTPADLSDKIRLEICPKIYTTGFLGQKFYTLKVGKLWLFLLNEKQPICIYNTYFSSFFVEILTVFVQNHTRCV